MTKIEAELRKKLDERGFVLFTGKRAFDVIDRLAKAGKLDGLSVQRSVFNGNGPEFRSQWKSPRSVTCYETTIQRVEQ